METQLSDKELEQLHTILRDKFDYVIGYNIVLEGDGCTFIKHMETIIPPKDIKDESTTLK